MKAIRIALACLALCGALQAQGAQPDPQQAKALHALFDQHWEAIAQRYPEWATRRGDLRYNDRLTDESAEALAEWDARNRAWLAQAKALKTDGLDKADRVSLALFIHNLEDEVAEQAFPGYRSVLMGALGGAQSHLANGMREWPMTSRQQVQQALARLAAYPKVVDDQIARMRRGQALGWAASRDVLTRVLEQIDLQLPADVASGPYYEPFKSLGKDIPQAQQAELQAAARDLIANRIAPAMRKLRAFVADEYIRTAPANGAMSSYPDGARVYELMVREGTTTNLSAAQIHAIGMRELGQIRAEMDGVMRQTKFEGTFAQFIEYLNTDKKFFAPSPEALLAGYRDIAKRIDAELPRYFAELPRLPYGVRGMPLYQGPDAAEYYNEPALDGTRPGYFNANIAGWRNRPTWRMATLTAHEAVPGHHLQIARNVELALPPFRRSGGYNAFAEGWAVYAETVGREMGIYDDPYSLFGHLQWRAFRAARLVVDTGIHGLGWSRAQAIDFMVERTGMDRAFVASEVDRYTSQPGQALGYMMGALKIAELRDRAKAKLGPRFDLRRFHNAVIDNGSLPLDVLERLIDEWIAEQARG